jgi:hypothetical protein
MLRSMRAIVKRVGCTRIFRWMQTSAGRRRRGEKDLDAAAELRRRLGLPLAARGEAELDRSRDAAPARLQGLAERQQHGLGAAPPQAEIIVVVAHPVGVAGDQDGLDRLPRSVALDDAVRSLVDQQRVADPVEVGTVEREIVDDVARPRAARRTVDEFRLGRAGRGWRRALVLELPGSLGLELPPFAFAEAGLRLAKTGL